MGMKDKKHSEESKAKIGLSRIGKKHSEETKKKMSLAKTGNKDYKYSILNNTDVLKIRILYKTKLYTYAKLGEMFNVSSPTILSIVKRRTWKHVEDLDLNLFVM